MSDRGSAYERELHDELHRELMAYATETEAWASERLARVMARLNAARPRKVKLAAHVLWIRPFNALTTAPHVYVSRRLLERMPDDESLAFVVAHECAHHDLGHLDLFRGWLEKLPRGAAGSLAAGYDGERCLHFFDVCETELLNRGDVDGVFGPENLLDPNDPGLGSFAAAAQRWVWTRTRRYLPLRERRELARAHLRRKTRRAPER